MLTSAPTTLCSETAPGFQCSNQLRPGLDGAQLPLERVAAADRLPGQSRTPPARSCASRRGDRRKLPTAAGTGKKAQKAKKQVTKGLKALNKTIGKARAKIPSDDVHRSSTPRPPASAQPSQDSKATGVAATDFPVAAAAGSNA